MGSNSTFAMLCLEFYVKYMILLVALKTLRNTFPTNVSLLIMESYLLLWDQIQRLQCYAWTLCELYDVTCCSENPKKHLLPGPRLDVTSI